MARCRHHSGYLAEDEAGHTAHVAQVQPSKKPLFPEMGPVSKQGYVPHPPLLDGPGGNPRRHRPRGPQPFGNFLDFLTKGQVLDSLQTVVEEATQRVATMKTEGGVPLLEVQDPVEEPSRRRARVRPSFSTVHWHRVRPGLCTGRPNNYPSRSSSASHCRSSLSAGCPGDLGARGPGLLPPVRDQLLLEKNLKRLLKLENKGGPHFRFPRKKQLPSISSKSEISHPSNPWYEELVDYLIKQAVSLLIYKYKFEKNLSRQLGFISFPVTKALMDLFLGFKKVKGSHISLSSQIDWTCLLRKLEEAEWTQRTSQQHSSQHSTEPHFSLPEPTTETDQDEATETNITVDPESPDQQLLALQEPTDGGEEEDNNYDKERMGSVDLKLSMTSSISLGSVPHKSKEAVNIQDTETSDNLEDNYSLGDEDTSQGLPEATVEAMSMASTDVGHGEPP